MFASLGVESELSVFPYLLTLNLGWRTGESCRGPWADICHHVAAGLAAPRLVFRAADVLVAVRNALLLLTAFLKDPVRTLIWTARPTRAGRKLQPLPYASLPFFGIIVRAGPLFALKILTKLAHPGTRLLPPASQHLLDVCLVVCRNVHP